MSQSGLTYAQSGVDYAGLDKFKRLAQERAALSKHFAEHLGIEELSWTRGESVHVCSYQGGHIGFTIEGLGTKNLVADTYAELRRIAHKSAEKTSYYNAIAQCCVAMIVNDMITLGILPAVIGMHPAVESAEWFADGLRNQELAEGWLHACALAECIWGPGETPALRDIIVPGATCLSGSSWGVSKKGVLFNPENIRHGDVILFVDSSGIHANGLTLARKIAGKLPEGYLTPLSDGRPYGEALLDPTLIYVRLIKDCIAAGIGIHYVVNITGHGWRKLMRAKGAFHYIVEHVPQPQPIFQFLQKHGPVDDREAYGNLNMGAGLALYLPSAEAQKLKDMVAMSNYPEQMKVRFAGYVEDSRERQVSIKPLGITFKSDELDI